MTTTSREIRLKRYPTGTPTEADFELAAVDVPAPGDGEVLVRNLWMSVDPYMRGRMTGQNTYVQGFAIGRPLEGGAVGRIVASRHPELREGDVVVNPLGWREAFVSDGRGLQVVDATVARVQAYLGVLGMPGMSAWVGLLRCGEPKAGDTVFVSGAAGAVGSAACQIAKIKGCRVIASAGGSDKVAWLRDAARVDAAFDYKEAKNVAGLVERLGQRAPDGLDVYFDNVGGDHLEAALQCMRDFGRIVLCGSISRYNEATPPPGPPSLFMATRKRLTLRGFIVSDHRDLQAEFLRDMTAWVKDGKVVWQETVVDGLEHAPRAFAGLFSGANTGKMLVRLADPGRA
jgi:NADPH-dependent curcumin reductase CurA